MGVYLIMLPKVDHQHLSFTDIERQVVVLAPLSQKPPLFSALSSLVIRPKMVVLSANVIMVCWGGDDAVDKTHVFGVRDLGSNPL